MVTEQSGLTYRLKIRARVVFKQSCGDNRQSVGLTLGSVAV